MIFDAPIMTMLLLLLLMMMMIIMTMVGVMAQVLSVTRSADVQLLLKAAACWS
jgi:F0F1-type ATP synthase assembly protein I